MPIAVFQDLVDFVWSVKDIYDLHYIFMIYALAKHQILLLQIFFLALTFIDALNCNILISPVLVETSAFVDNTESTFAEVCDEVNLKAFYISILPRRICYLVIEPYQRGLRLYDILGLNTLHNIYLPLSNSIILLTLYFKYKSLNH